MQTESVQLEMRLWALEVLTVNLFVMLCAASGDGRVNVESIGGQMIAGARARAFPGFDPVQSDALSQELEAAVTRLVDMARSQIPGITGYG
jgi:hypothetical protein